MRKLIYHIATTVDNFIAHPDGSATDGFLYEGEHVTEYVQSLQQDYDTVLMGKHTYENGYAFGLEPGQPAYPNMKHYIFSRTLRFDNSHEQVEIVDKDEAEFVRQLKSQPGKPIYLCGGGEFAGFLLEHELIDELLIKLNPSLLGSGIRLFGSKSKRVNMSLINSKVYDNGVVLLGYQLNYGSQV